MDTVNERIALAEENLTKVSGDLEETREEIVTEIKEDLSSKADLVLNNTFNGEQVFSNDVTFGKTIYLNNVEDPDMSTTLDGSSLSTTNVTTFTINNNDLTFTDGEIVIGDKVLTFDGEDEVIPANSVTDEARMFARVAQESAAIAEEGASVASSAAVAADTSATNASQSATVAAESAAAIEGANDAIANYDAHWRAYYKTVTSLPTGYLQGAPITKFEYDMPKLTTAQSCFNTCKNLRSFTGSLQALTNGRTFFTDCNALTIFESDLSALTSAYGMFYGAPLASFGAPLGKLTDGTRMFVDCQMQIFASDLPALTTGSMMFYACQLNKESALRVLGSIPTYESGSHPITIGIHVDNQADEEVLAAIEAAKVKGWTITTQWNGTATASTFALRPTPQPPIYTKREHDELGEYIDASGVRYALDWGHSVISPHGTPEELGYTLFDTLEDALTSLGLTEYMEIPQEEQNNN